MCEIDCNLWFSFRSPSPSTFPLPCCLCPWFNLSPKCPASFIARAKWTAISGSHFVRLRCSPLPAAFVPGSISRPSAPLALSHVRNELRSLVFVSFVFDVSPSRARRSHQSTLLDICSVIPPADLVQFMRKLLETSQVSIVLPLHYIWRLEERIELLHHRFAGIQV